MKLSERDRKLLILWVAMVTLGVGYWFFWPENASVPVPKTATVESVDMAEQRLARLRNIAATAPGKQDVLKKVQAELATRETGLLQAATVQQAEAQIIAILRELLSLEATDIRSSEMAPVEPLTDPTGGVSYGLAPVRVQFECGMAQLVNVLAGLGARKELIATRSFQILASNPKEKTVRVALLVVGVVPKELVPDKSKKGVAGF